MNTDNESQNGIPTLPTFIETWLTMAEENRGIDLELPYRSQPREFELEETSQR